MMEIKTALEETGGDESAARQILKKRGFDKANKRAGRETKQGLVATYTHTNGKIGAMVEFRCETDFVARNDEFKTTAFNLCLQVAAMAPRDVKELEAQEFIKDPSQKVGDLIKSLAAKFGENIRIGRMERCEI